MKKSVKPVCGVLSMCSALSVASCKMANDDVIKLTVWVSEADKAFATSVAEEFKANNPDKQYNIVIDIQGENDVATRVLNDVENAADVYSCLNDQMSKLINGDALTRIAGDRLTRVMQANSEESMESVTLTVKGEEGVYGMPYTDNTFFLYYDKSVLTETDVKSTVGTKANLTKMSTAKSLLQEGQHSIPVPPSSLCSVLHVPAAAWLQEH